MSDLRRPNMSPADVSARYEYNPRTGIVLHRKNGKNYREFSPAGNFIGKHHYLSLCGTNFRTDRVVWFMQTGDWIEIEHIDGNTKNLKLDNLRPTKPVYERELERLHVIFYPDRLEITTTLPEATQNALRDLLEPFVTSR